MCGVHLQKADLIKLTPLDVSSYKEFWKFLASCCPCAASCTIHVILGAVSGRNIAYAMEGRKLIGSYLYLIMWYCALSLFRPTSWKQGQILHSVIIGASVCKHNVVFVNSHGNWDPVFFSVEGSGAKKRASLVCQWNLSFHKIRDPWTVFIIV